MSVRMASYKYELYRDYRLDAMILGDGPDEDEYETQEEYEELCSMLYYDEMNAEYEWWVRETLEKILKYETVSRTTRSVSEKALQKMASCNRRPVRIGRG